MIQRCQCCQAIFSDKDRESAEPVLRCEVCNVANWIKWTDDPMDSNLQIGTAAFYRYPGDGRPLVLAFYADTGLYRFHHADRSGSLTAEDGRMHELDSLDGALAWLRFLGYRFAGPYQIH